MSHAYLCHLDTRWTASGDEHGRFLCRLTNISDQPISGFRLGLTTVTLNLQPSKLRNAKRVRFDGSCLEVVETDPRGLEPGHAWEFEIAGLFRKPRHLTDGMSAAYLVLDDGTLAGVHSGDLMLEDARTLPPGPDMPAGELTVPIGLMPWPNQCAVADFALPPPALFAAPGADVAMLAAMAEASQLAKRLFPNQPAPFALSALRGGRSVQFEAVEGMADAHYGIDFAPDRIVLRASGGLGRWYGLITLAQLHHAAQAEPQTFGFPATGSIIDGPRYGWRGSHLDVSRQFYPIEQVRRFIDILAWNKMNVLHWHLTDDEGWRIEIKAFPELTTVGNRRGPTEPGSPQLGTGVESVTGFYTQAEIAALVAHAGRVQVGVMPELDVPGHSAALLTALPHLSDPGEPRESYFSGQGFPNNALNPAMPEVYDVLETIFGEVAALFPFPYLHIGGDEVAHQAWMASPKAVALMASEGLDGKAALQSYFLRRIKTMLDGLGKRLAGWNEVSHGGGVEREGTLLTIWERTHLGPELAREGYEVIMSPGEAYYLDMARSNAWLEPGHHWAGTVPVEKSYAFEAAESFPDELEHRLKGLQAGIWGENLTSRDRFNHMVFPRLGAVAEAAWTKSENKNWLRFAAQSRLMPHL